MESQNNDLLVFLLGIIAGSILTFIFNTLMLGSLAKKTGQAEREKDLRDPANWWKYGGDPFNYGDDDDYDSEDD
jgi:hypothetical protein